MSIAKSGITKETLQSMVLDAGVVYLNYGLESEKVLGATSGGNKFSVEREIKTTEVDGARGKVKGLRRLIAENVSLTTNLKELNARNIQLALAGSTLSDVMDEDLVPKKTHDKITTSSNIQDNDYLENISLVAELSGSKDPVIITLYNALSDGSFEMGLTDTEEAVVEVTFSAHYNPLAMDEPIYDIRFPVLPEA